MRKPSCKVEQRCYDDVKAIETVQGIIIYSCDILTVIDILDIHETYCSQEIVNGFVKENEDL